MEFTIELPLNQTGLGAIGCGIAIEIYERGLYPNLFCIGEPNFNFTNLPEGFQEWYQLCSNKALRKYKKDQPSIKLWHIQGSHERLTDNATLLTAHETDRLTPVEVNILKQFNRVLVPSNYSKKVFEAHDLSTVQLCSNFYDDRVFSKVEVARKGVEEGEVTMFSLFGKMEKRKRTIETIKTWARRFGGDKKYRLNCFIYNHFFVANHRIDPKFAVAAHKQYIEQQIGQNLPWNINIFGFLNKEEFNYGVNSTDIELALSGGEGFGLPTLTSRVLGKRGVILKAHSFVDFCSNDDSTWVEPSGKEDSSDGIFFMKGGDFNQGEFFKWDEDEVIAAMEESVGKDQPDPKIGEELAKKFSVRNCVDLLLNF